MTDGREALVTARVETYGRGRSWRCWRLRSRQTVTNGVRDAARPLQGARRGISVSGCPDARRGARKRPSTSRRLSLVAEGPDIGDTRITHVSAGAKPRRIAFFLVLAVDAVAWAFFLFAWGDQEDPYALAGALVVAFFFAACGVLVSILGLIAAAFGTRNREERLGYSLIALAASFGSLVLFVATIETAASILD